MKAEDVEITAQMVALDYDNDHEKGFREAKEHALGHLEVVPQHCYIVEDENKQIIGTMILHPQEKIFEIEDFHVNEIERNREALALLKTKLMGYLENVKTEVLCCPYAIRRLMKN